ncbi:MAG: alpha/beta fold hydrolase [Caldimonas sp.]
MLERPEGPRHAYVYTGGKVFDPQRPVVVFLHGALHDHSVWTLLARWFAHHGHAVLAPDLPGHARSHSEALASVEALAGWTLGLLDAAGVQRAALVGHSMGSLIALETAGRAPQRVSHLAMLGTAFPMAVSSALLDTARDAPLRAIDMVNAYSHSTMAGKPAYPGPGTWLHGAARALMRRVQASQHDCNLFLRDFEVCNSYANGLVAARQVACPVDFVLGAKDQMTVPRQAAELAAALHARVTTVDAGHALMEEAPDAVLAALRAALARPPVDAVPAAERAPA